MAQQMRFSKTFGGAGLSIIRNYELTDEFCGGWVFDGIPVARAGVGTTWVKVENDEATVTLPAEHGYSNGDFDVYWDGGRRYGVPGTILTNALTLGAGGAGDNFPASETAVVIAAQTTRQILIDGNTMTALAMEMAFVPPTASARASVDFLDAVDASEGQVDLDANKPRDWDMSQGDTTPIGDVIVTAKISHADTANVGTLTIIALGDSEPAPA